MCPLDEPLRFRVSGPTDDHLRECQGFRGTLGGSTPQPGAHNAVNTAPYPQLTTNQKSLSSRTVIVVHAPTCIRSPSDNGVSTSFGIGMRPR